ncbi:MAG: hypothetical protein VYD64_03490 [Pseudomonadota bacterium]|nr:hypothetical protein [Pseudomonadota bacterium]
MSEILAILSFGALLELPWYVGMPGLALIALLLWSALRSLLTMRPLKAIVRLVFAFAVAIILSQAGTAIAELVGGAPG